MTPIEFLKKLEDRAFSICDHKSEVWIKHHLFCASCLAQAFLDLTREFSAAENIQKVVAR